MGITFKKDDGGVFVMRITGILKKSELDALQSAAAKVMDADPLLRGKVLIIAVNFQGWERGADWGDLTFFNKYGDKVTKIAVIGDPKRETEFKMFLGAGYRAAPFKFFPLEQGEQARTWLAE